MYMYTHPHIDVEKCSKTCTDGKHYEHIALGNYGHEKMKYSNVNEP